MPSMHSKVNLKEREYVNVKSMSHPDVPRYIYVHI